MGAGGEREHLLRSRSSCTLILSFSHEFRSYYGSDRWVMTPLEWSMQEFAQRKPVVSCWRKILRWILQIFIGGIIFLSGFGKSLDLPGFIEVLNTYQAFPFFMLRPLAFIITGIECMLGVWILSGHQLSLSALAGALLNSIYAVWVVITLLRGLTLSNCGCFGIFFPQPLTWFTPIGDLVLVGLCVVLAYLARTEEYPDRRLPRAFLN